MCKPNDKQEWVVRYEHLKTGKAAYHIQGATTVWINEATKMSRSEAIQLAKAVRNGSREYTARAMRFVNTATGTKKEVAE